MEDDDIKRCVFHLLISESCTLKKSQAATKYSLGRIILIRAQNAKVRLMRGSEIVIMESVQREDGRCESFTEHDEPVMELHTEWKHQAMPGSPVTEIRYQ